MRDSQLEPHKKLLALVMIVKDEAPSIRASILSCLDACDHVLILDTGSTDGTPELAEAAIRDGNVSGEVVRGVRFVDFSQARNAALDRLGTRTTFSLFLSGDETLRGGSALAHFLLTVESGSRGAFNVRVEFGGQVYDSPRVARTASSWRYRGVVHEVLVPPPDSGERPADFRVPNCSVFHDVSRRTTEVMVSRWERDANLLEAVVRNSSENVDREVFYLAQSLELMARAESDQATACRTLARARYFYLLRSRLGGWQEEAAEALYRATRLAEDFSILSWEELQEEYLRHHAMAPHRCEGLLRIAYRWRREGAWHTALLFVNAACAMQYPEGDLLPIDRGIWDFDRWLLQATICSWLPEARERGREALRRAEEARPGSPLLESCRSAYAKA